MIQSRWSLALTTILLICWILLTVWQSRLFTHLPRQRRSDARCSACLWGVWLSCLKTVHSACTEFTSALQESSIWCSILAKLNARKTKVWPRKSPAWSSAQLSLLKKMKRFLQKVGTWTKCFQKSLKLILMMAIHAQEAVWVSIQMKNRFKLSHEADLKTTF
jgi:hypothetical protein